MNGRRFIYLFLSLVMIFAIQSCGSSGSDKDQNAEEFGAAEEDLEGQIEGLRYNLPEPAEIPYILQQTGADYNAGLLNPTANADQYTTPNDKAALNLGVYAADIGYLSSYDKTQEAIDYLNTAKKLADELNVIGTFDATMLQRFEQNISNKDSLADLINKSVERTGEYLKNDNRDKLAALVTAGSVIEGLHIATGLVESYPKDLLPDDSRNLVLTPIIKVVLDQKETVSELSKMLSNIEQTDLIASLRDDLQRLEQTYNSLNIDEKISNNRADLMLSDENLVEITEIVDQIRAKITN
jgi:hypothetical protein